METANYELKISRPKSEGKILAYVKVQSGPFWVTFRLEQANGKFFLNPPSSFVGSLKGQETRGGGKHSGWVDNAGLTKEAAQDIKAKALAELGLEEQAA